MTIKLNLYTSQMCASLNLSWVGHACVCVSCITDQLLKKCNLAAVLCFPSGDPHSGAAVTKDSLGFP